jgi:hypothetical protein
MISSGHCARNVESVGLAGIKSGERIVQSGERIVECATKRICDGLAILAEGRELGKLVGWS